MKKMLMLVFGIFTLMIHVSNAAPRVGFAGAGMGVKSATGVAASGAVIGAQPGKQDTNKRFDAYGNPWQGGGSPTLGVNCPCSCNCPLLSNGKCDTACLVSISDGTSTSNEKK